MNKIRIFGLAGVLLLGAAAFATRPADAQGARTRPSVSPTPNAVQDNSAAIIQRANTTLDNIAKLIDGIKERQARQIAEGGSQVAIAVETMKCPACGMEMSTKKTNPAFKAFEIKGKVFYCCTGCKMTDAKPVNK
jgi:hypothetical protein